jgi:hypothetical protein
MAKLEFAPGVRFDAALHQYWKNGKQLSGVTGVIGKHLGIKYHEGTVAEARGEGLHVHGAIQEWIDAGCDPGHEVSIHPGVVWLTTTLIRECGGRENIKNIYSEVLVSDGFMYASSVDIIVETVLGKLILLDTKRSFKRPSVTIQLNMYKYLVEKYGGREVEKLICACFGDQDYYPISIRSHAESEKIFYKAK